MEATINFSQANNSSPKQEENKVQSKLDGYFGQNNKTQEQPASDLQASSTPTIQNIVIHDNKARSKTLSKEKESFHKVKAIIDQRKKKGKNSNGQTEYKV